VAWKTSVLVIANQTADSPELVAALERRRGEGDAQFTLLLPPLSGVDRADARKRIEHVLARWREAGLEAEGELGDSDPIVAVKEVWDPGRFDEIVVSTLATGTSRWLQIDLPHRVERMTGVAVRHVIGTPAAQPAA
jgi:GABA permease